MTACAVHTARTVHTTCTVSSDSAMEHGALPAETIDRLRALPLFAAVDRAGLVTLLKSAAVCIAERHEILFRQGDPADRFYIVLQG